MNYELWWDDTVDWYSWRTTEIRFTTTTTAERWRSGTVSTSCWSRWQRSATETSHLRLFLAKSSPSSSSSPRLYVNSLDHRPVWGRGTPLPLLSIYFLIFSPFYFFLSFLGFTYFLLLSIPSLSTRIVPLHFQAGGRRRRPNLGLVCLFFV